MTLGNQLLATAALLCLFTRGGAQSGCTGNKCPDQSTCTLEGGAPVCVCPPNQFSRLRNGVCTNKPLLRWGYLDPHNAARAAAGVGELSWDDNLARAAQRWADSLARDQQCGLALDPQRTWGQNVANFFQDKNFMNNDAVNLWVHQGGQYRYARFNVRGAAGCATGKWQDCAAYTQVMWSNTKKIGCGVARCPNFQGKVWVCNYSPPGNIPGEFPYRR